MEIVPAAVVRAQHVEGNPGVGVEIHPPLRFLGSDQVERGVRAPFVGDVCQLLKIHPGPCPRCDLPGDRLCMHCLHAAHGGCVEDGGREGRGDAADARVLFASPAAPITAAGWAVAV